MRVSITTDQGFIVSMKRGRHGDAEISITKRLPMCEEEARRYMSNFIAPEAGERALSQFFGDIT